jgi:hypothetical protein
MLHITSYRKSMWHVGGGFMAEQAACSIMLVWEKMRGTELPQPEERKEMAMGRPRWAAIMISMVAICGCRISEPQIPSAPKPSRDTSLSYFIEEPIELFADRQEAIYKEFEETQYPEVKDRNEHILAELWKERLLNNDIKDRLVDKHYRLVLVQFVGSYPAYHFIVRCRQTFPFPSVEIQFWQMISVNGKVALASDGPRVVTAMSNNYMNVASLSGGRIGRHNIEPGDVMQYTIRLQEEWDKEIIWQKSIPTNRIVVRPYKGSAAAPSIDQTR